MYPVNPPVTLLRVDDTSVVYTVPELTVGVGVAPVNAAPYQFRVQVPLCGEVRNGSVEVDAMARPVSNPNWLVTYGNSRFVTQGMVVKMLLAVDVSAKRGIGPIDAVVTVLVGA